MMISPKLYVEEHKHDSFEQLIIERDKMIDELRELEKIVFKGDHTDEAWMIRPGPDVQYQMTLEYLAELFKYMSKKYNKEFEQGL